MGALRDLQREERQEKERLDQIFKSEMAEMRSRHRMREVNLKQKYVEKLEEYRGEHAEERAKNVSRHNRRMADMEAKYIERRKALEPPAPEPKKRSPIERIVFGDDDDDANAGSPVIS